MAFQNQDPVFVQDFFEFIGNTVSLETLSGCKTTASHYLDPIQVTSNAQKQVSDYDNSIVAVVFVMSFFAYCNMFVMCTTRRTTKKNLQARDTDSKSRQESLDYASVANVVILCLLAAMFNYKVHRYATSSTILENRLALMANSFFDGIHHRVEDFGMAELCIRLTVSWLVYDNRFHRFMVFVLSRMLRHCTGKAEFEEIWHLSMLYPKKVYTQLYIMKSVVMGFCMCPILALFWRTLPGKVFCILFATCFSDVMILINPFNTLRGGWKLLVELVLKRVHGLVEGLLRSFTA